MTVKIKLICKLIIKSGLSIRLWSLHIKVEVEEVIEKIWINLTQREAEKNTNLKRINVSLLQILVKILFQKHVLESGSYLKVSVLKLGKWTGNGIRAPRVGSSRESQVLSYEFKEMRELRISSMKLPRK